MSLTLPLNITNEPPTLKGNKVLERLEKKLLHYTGKAIADYKLIEKGDRVMVCLSGGKDSHTMLHILNTLRKRSGFKFEIFSFTLDQGQPGWLDTHLRQYIEEQKIPYEIMTEDTYSIVTDKIPENKTYCSLCSRLRRGIIYTYAQKNGFNKIALGHHRDDTITTLLMSIFYNGQMKAMPPKLKSDDGKNIVIRPLIYCQEADIINFAKIKKFPIIPCNLCGAQENLVRKKVQKLIKELSADNPKVPSNMLHAIQSIQLSQLMDKKLFDFAGLEKDAF